MDDWRLLLSLYHLGEWDGMVSTDAKMLSLPRELAVIHQTRLTLIAVEQAGHDPVRAAGLLLVHLPAICRKSVRSTGQIWNWARRTRTTTRPGKSSRGSPIIARPAWTSCFTRSKLSQEELGRDPLQEVIP